MYNSIKKWVNVPFQYKSFIKRTGAGTKQYSDAQDAVCYPVGDVKQITDAAGAEVISTTQLYVDGKVPITVKDAVIFENEERPILRITNYYRDGAIDIRVVYL